MSSLPARPWVYLPVQTKVREIVAKVLLSSVLAEQGMGSLLMTHRRFRPQADVLPPGIVGDYSVTRPFLPLFERYREAGHRVVAWEEEGLADIPTDAVAGCERFLAWGRAEAHRCTAARPQHAARVRVTGNPRFDLLRPEMRELMAPAAERLREKHGSFILVNGNFTANVHYGEAELKAQWAMEYDVFTPELKAYYDERWDHSATLFAHFKAMVPALATAHPDRTVIVRPHPSEDMNVWRWAMADHPNVKVIFDGPVLDWLVAADAVLHNSCTTAIESAVLGRPTIAYRPVINNVQDWALANDVSRTAKDLDELVELVGAVLAGRAPKPSREALRTLQHHVAALEGPFAAERMAAEMAQVALPAALLPAALGQRAVAGEAWYDAKHRVKTVLGRTGTPLAFEKQKNPGWSGKEIVQILSDLQRVSGRFDRVRVSHLASGVTALWA